MLKSIIVAGAMVTAASAFAQSTQTSNFILGHGMFPVAPVTADYPPGHQLNEKNVSLPANRAATEPADKAREATEKK